jgi:hypothetical protein
MDPKGRSRAGLTGLLLLGLVSGPFVLAAGIGGWLVFLAVITLGPLAVGAVGRVRPLAWSAAFNFLAVVSDMATKSHWYREHGFDLRRRADVDAEVIVVLAVLAAAGSLLALVPRIFRAPR